MIQIAAVVSINTIIFTFDKKYFKDVYKVKKIVNSQNVSNSHCCGSPHRIGHDRIIIKLLQTFVS